MARDGSLGLRYPMKCEVFEKRFPKHTRKIKDAQMVFESATLMSMKVGAENMGLAPDGRMRQDIYKDPFKLSDWDMDQRSRCFVHLTNSLVWRAIIGDAPPTVPFTAKEYTDHGLPWFDYYSDNSTALKGSEKLKVLKSVVEMGIQYQQYTMFPIQKDI